MTLLLRIWRFFQKGWRLYKETAAVYGLLKLLGITLVPSALIVAALNYFGEHSAALLTIIFLIAAAVILLGTLVWFDYRRQKIKPSIGLTTSLPAPLTHDVWLQDAVFYAVFGKWDCDEQIDITKGSAICDAMRQLANNGQYTIWGKTDAGALHVEIPKDFWVHNQINILHVLGGAAPELAETESTVHGHWQRYFALRVNKAQTEKLWPAAVGTGPRRIGLR